MRASVLPMSEVPGDWVREYLARRGMPRHVVEWKYFDRTFTGGNPGYVWISADRVRGFVGVIPFAVAGGGNSTARSGSATGRSSDLKPRPEWASCC